MAIQELRDQAGRLGGASASRANTCQRRRDCRSKWRRARSPARAASYPAPRFIRAIAKTRDTTAGRRPHLTAAAPRHLFHRGSRRADHDLKNANRDARIQREARCREVGVGTIAAGVAKARADVPCSISRYDGGTNCTAPDLDSSAPASRGSSASPKRTRRSSQQSRVAHRRIETDGQLKTQAATSSCVAAAARARVWFRHRAARRDGLHHDARVVTSNTCPVRRRDAGSQLRRRSPASRSTS